MTDKERIEELEAMVAILEQDIKDERNINRRLRDNMDMLKTDIIELLDAY